MRSVVAALAVAMGVAGGAQAQTANDGSVCSRLASAVEVGADNLAMQHADAMTANTVGQAQQYAAEQANTLNLLQLNIQIMLANHCPAPTQPVTRGAYVNSVIDCMKSQGEDALARCDRSKWSAEPGAPEPRFRGRF